MNNIFTLVQIARKNNLDSNWIQCQYKLNLDASFMEIVSVNPNLKQD